MTTHNIYDMPEVQSMPEQVRAHLMSDKNNVDTMLAKELYNMSIQEREEVYEGIHGVGQPIKETPEIVEKSLSIMEEELAKIPEKKAYDLGFQLNPGYVGSKSFRLKFLRADNFDPQLAACRIVKFMEHRLKWFGPESLGRPLLLSDLGKEDMDALKTGMFQILPSRDTTGRLVIMDFKKLIPMRLGWEHYFRAHQYILSAATEDEEVQTRGVVAVNYYIGKQVGKLDYNLAINTRESLECLPMKVAALHGCMNDPLLMALKPAAMLVMGKYLRARTRLHEGSHNEVQYKLMTYGIPVDTFPVSHQGDVRTANHKKWLARRKAKDDHFMRGEPFKGIDLPGRNDVILRRGRVFHDHPGNLRMRLLVETCKDAYGVASPEEKENIGKNIVKVVHENSGRFIERDDDGWWVEVSHKEAVKRVCKAIRSARSTTAVLRQQKRIEEAESNKRLKVTLLEQEPVLS